MTTAMIDTVAHEPPLFELLPERDHWRTVMKQVTDTFEADGPGPAGEVLGAALQMRGAAEGDERVPGGGDHGGFGNRSAEFAATLSGVLAE
jgi:hypothetical protein